MTIASTVNNSESNVIRGINNKWKGLHYFGKLVASILFRPAFNTVKFTLRSVKLLTWDSAKSALYKISGFHTESAEHFESEYLKTVKVARDILFTPTVIKRAYMDMVGKREYFVDDLSAGESFIKVPCTKQFDQYASYLHGVTTVEVSRPDNVSEFPATTDGSLQTIMASHLFKPGMLAINFGSPNVATFLTKEEDGKVQTVKVDAKSLRREKMKFHATNGKIQSGIFFVPKNLPPEALQRYEDAAKAMQGRKDYTCVNTNARVLEAAGFSIEGAPMDQIIFPNTFFEHLLYRNVFYTDSNGIKHKVHFEIVNTTPYTIEQYMEKVDTAVVGTRLRHKRRNRDTVEKQEIRGAAAKAIIAAEAVRLKNVSVDNSAPDMERRRATVSVPSNFGNLLANIWGRHTIYEMDLSDKRDEIKAAFVDVAQVEGIEKLRPFPQTSVSLTTRLKRDFFFSGPMIRFLRRHMMGHVDTIFMNSKDLFSHLKSTKGERLNYVLLGDKVVVAKVHANNESNHKHRKAADWALSKHALLANREEVYCSGEMWYDEVKKSFMLNSDSGTYIPTQARVERVATLANNIFKSDSFKAVQNGEQ